MLKECLEIFKNQLDEKGMNLIFDRYIPKDGSYVLVPIVDQELLKSRKIIKQAKFLAEQIQVFRIFVDMIFIVRYKT